MKISEQVVFKIFG